MSMKKLLLLLPIALLWLLIPNQASSLEIVLTTPISPGRSLDRVRVDNISDHPERQQPKIVPGNRHQITYAQAGR